MFEIDSKTLKGAIGLAGKYINTKSALEVLSTIKIGSLEDGRIILQATNFESAVTIVLQAAVKEPGSTCAPAKKLAEILNQWDSRIHASLESKVHKLSINGDGAKKVELKCFSPDEFPPIRGTITGFAPQCKLKVRTEAFAAAVKRVAVAASDDVARPVLTGIHFRVENGLLVLEAANGFILAQDKIDDWSVDGIDPSGIKLIVPAKVLLDVVRFADENEIEICFDIENEGVNYVTFAIPSKGVEFGSLSIAGNYPDLDQIIPHGEKKNQFRVDGQELARVLELVNVISETKITRFDVDYSSQEVKISAINEAVGNMEDVLAITNANQTEGGLSTAFNCNLLSRITLDYEMTFGQDADNTPARLTCDDLPNYVGVIMPMMIIDP